MVMAVLRSGVASAVMATVLLLLLLLLLFGAAAVSDPALGLRLLEPRLSVAQHANALHVADDGHATTTTPVAMVRRGRLGVRVAPVQGRLEGRVEGRRPAPAVAAAREVLQP